MKEGTEMDDDWRVRWNIGVLGLLSVVAVSFGFGQHEASTRAEEVQIQNGGVVLSGTITMPTTQGPHPAIMLIHGSIPADRTDPFFQTFVKLFSKSGLAVLFYDKRGAGKSTGNHNASTLADFAGDAVAGVNFLRKRKDIDPKRIGVWGISQGGWLSFVVASKVPDLAFIISVSGPAVTPGEQMIYFRGNELRQKGLPEEEVTLVSNFRRDLWSYFRTNSGYDNVRKQFAQLKSGGLQEKAGWPPAGVEVPKPEEIDSVSFGWFKGDMGFDPVPYYASVRCPVLAVFGEKDILIPVQKTIDIMKAELGKRKVDFTSKVFPGANHVIQIAESGKEMGQSPFASGYLGHMENWLLKRFGEK